MSEETTVCWICYDEKPSKKDNGPKWIRPCKCSLECHEECLLKWIESQEKYTRQYKCPQCRQVYRIIEIRPLPYTIMKILSKVIDYVVPGMIVLSTTASVIVVLSSYGLHTMYAICGSIEARRILSIMRQMNPSIWLGIPAIPIAMLVNKLSFMPVYFPLVPLAITGYNTSTLACPPSKALTLASIPLISSVYRLLWVKTLGNLQLKWDGQFQKSKAAGIALRDPNNLDDHDDDDEVAQIEIGVNEGDAPEDNPDRDNDGQGAGLRWNIVVSLEGVIREFIWTLLTPTLGSVCGSILGMSPRIAGLFPQKFHRSIIGAFTAVVLRDLMKFWYSYLTYYVRKSRRIA